MKTVNNSAPGADKDKQEDSSLGSAHVWMRAESADPQERPFTQGESKRLLKLQEQKGITGNDAWAVIDGPTPE